VRADGDAWTRCAAGHRHWGRYGAAGLLLRDRGDGTDRVVLQHRASWSHQGDTWGVPGGARTSTESAVHAALRETEEEAGIDPAAVRPTGILVDDHGGWSYATVLGEPIAPVHPRATGGESAEVRWVDVDAVDSLPLHPGFAAAWPRLRSAPPGTVLVVDAANVVGARGGGDGWWRDRAGATRRLAAALAPLRDGLPAAALPPGVDPGPLDTLLPRVLVVVEGAARRVLHDVPPPGVELVAAAGSGDDAILEVAAGAADRRPVLAVTADRGLRARLAEAGAATVGPSWLLRLIDGPAGARTDGR
jgi:8-oxo-dGTP pyrophosphatase MutT (NUDIX family)